MTDNIARASALGMDHAEINQHTGKRTRLHSGREVASALGLTGLTGEEYVSLREAYGRGWSAYF